MENINYFEIFSNGFENPEQNIIQSLNIDIDMHKVGIMNLFKMHVHDFIIDEDNKKAISLLFNYFIGNKQFCDENGISLSKGIMFCGGVGTGKSVLMKSFKTYTGEILKVNGFQYFDASEIIDSVNIYGVEYLDKFSHNLSSKKANPISCYIDDIISKNEKIKNYGTEISVIEQLISIRYNIFTRYRKLTHFSTNIYPAEMGKYYDERIIDRLTEMCNIIELPGSSRRK
jgi:hypothetical protein